MNSGLPNLGNVPRPADTTPEMHERQVAMLMARSGEARFLMGIRMFDAARAMVQAAMPPDLSEIEQKRWLFLRLYGNAAPF